MQDMTGRSRMQETPPRPVGSPGSRGWLLHALLAVVVTFAAGALGNLATMPQIPTWYAGLAKPSFNPPNWVFGPVWTLLYAFMAYAFWRILQVPPGSPGRRTAIRVFLVQLGLNALWSVVFFGLHRPGLAIVVVVLLEIGILAMIVAFRRLDPVAGWINVPYALWVAYATLLNVSIVVLNGAAP
jgi:translocator protein